MLPAIELSNGSETDNTRGEKLDEKLEEIRSQNMHVNINGEIKDDTGINNKLTLRQMNIYRE